MNDNYIKKSLPIIKQAIKEDIGTGDITTDAIISNEKNCTAKLIAKSTGIISGLAVAQKVFELISGKPVIWEIKFDDGMFVKPGDVIAEIKGSFQTILNGERTALNFLQRMSGIATNTNMFVEKLKGTNTILLDTRKTLPGFRYLDKYSVKVGGGKNHRFGLYDMVMIKENHIRAAGSITKVVKNIKEKYGKKYKIEVETTSLKEVKETLVTNIDIIMLDNMNLKEMTDAVLLVNGKVKTEASGNVNLETIEKIASTGVDFISVGSITHSVKAMDISLIIN